MPAGFGYGVRALCISLADRKITDALSRSPAFLAPEISIAEDDVHVIPAFVESLRKSHFKEQDTAPIALTDPFTSQ